LDAAYAKRGGGRAARPHTAVLCGGRMYVLGGSCHVPNEPQEGAVFSDHWSLDLASMAWREEEPLRAGGEHRPSFAHSAVVSEQGVMGGASPVIAVFGGMDVQQGDAGLPALVLPGPPLLLPVQRQWRPVQSGRLLLFAPGDKAWSLPRTGGASPLPRFRHSATLCARGTADEAMLLWGGWRYPVGFQATPLEPFPRERDISPDEIALLHMRTLTWTYPVVSAGPRPPPRAAHTATLIGESLLLYGGAANHERNHEEDLGDTFVLDTAAWAYRRLNSACAPEVRRSSGMVFYFYEAATFTTFAQAEAAARSPPPRSSHSAVLLPMSLFDGRGGGRGGGSGNSSGGTSGGGGAVCPSEAGLAVLILGGRDFVPAVTPFSPPQNRSRDDAHLLWLSAGWEEAQRRAAVEARREAEAAALEEQRRAIAAEAEAKLACERAAKEAERLAAEKQARADARAAAAARNAAMAEEERRKEEAAKKRAEEERAKLLAKAAEQKAAKKEAKEKNQKAKKAKSKFKLEEERRVQEAAELRMEQEKAAQLAGEQEARRVETAKREAAARDGATGRAAPQQMAAPAEALRPSDEKAEVAERLSVAESLTHEAEVVPAARVAEAAEAVEARAVAGTRNGGADAGQLAATMATEAAVAAARALEAASVAKTEACEADVAAKVAAASRVARKAVAAAVVAAASKTKLQALRAAAASAATAREEAEAAHAAALREARAPAPSLPLRLRRICDALGLEPGPNLPATVRNAAAVLGITPVGSGLLGKVLQLEDYLGLA